MNALVALLALLAALGAAHAGIVDLTIVNDERPLIQLTKGFGFAPDQGRGTPAGEREQYPETDPHACNAGVLHVSVTNLTIPAGKNTSRSARLNQMALFVSSLEEELLQELQTEQGKACILDIIPDGPAEEDKDILLRFSDSSVKMDSSEAAHVVKDQALSGNAYLYFGNCNPPGVVVSFNIHVEQYNEDARGNKDYLSSGDLELGILYWTMFAFFTITTGAWFYLVWKNKAHAQRIHYLMGVLGALKALTLMSQAVSLHYVEISGSSDGWNVAYYVFTFFRGILFFTVIVLIGTGWSYMKPFLGDREKRILMVVIPLQVFANIAIIVTDEENPSDRDWFTWRDLFHLVDIICCCAILFPIVWSIKNLREASQTDGKAARNLEKLTLFRQFYVMVVVYIYFTRIVVYLLRNTVPYEYAWVSDAADELATLTFYVWTAVSFRPTEANPYLKLPVGDSDIELNAGQGQRSA